MDVARIRGVLPPMITPLKQDGQALDLEGLERFLYRNVEAGVDGFLVWGSSGEGLLVDSGLRERLISAVARLTGGTLPILVGVGGLRATDVLSQIRQAHDRGASAVLALPPLCYKVPQSAVYGHFKELADQSPLPVLLYSIPQVAGNSITTETVCRLAQHPNIIGIKDSSGDRLFFQSVLASVQREDFRVFQGKAELVQASLLEGAVGSITLFANVAPEVEVRLHGAVAAGDMALAGRLQLATALFMKAVVQSGLPLSSVAKTILAHETILERPGSVLPHVRVPSFDSPEFRDIARALADLKAV